MNRRNVLIGLGGLVAGGGALLGTGAFTTVEAERTVSIETAGDASAFLGLSPARDDFEGVEGENFVVESDDGTIQINLDGASPGEGDGLNRNAITTFRDLVTVSNNGTQAIDTLILEFTDGPGSANLDDTFSFTVGDVEDTIDNGGNILGGDGINQNLESGLDVDFGIQIDLINGGDGDGDLTDGDYTLTITAEAEDDE